MVVHVRLKVKSEKGHVKEIIVLVNGGAHSPEPVLVVDENTARELGYEDGEAAEASLADTTRKVYLVRDALELTLMGEETEELSKIRAHLVIHPRLEEPLITDTTIDEAGIQVISFGKGLWRHTNDPPTKMRKTRIKST